MIEREKENISKSLKDKELNISRLSFQLKRFQERNLDTKHINYKIYHLLTNPFIYVNAYCKISKNAGALTKGITDDKEIMKFFGISNANEIANKFKNENYSWSPTRRTWIPKPGKNKKRPIDTPTQEDRIVQEALRGILECIYEPEFREFESYNEYKSTNYGFRPNKSTWDAANNLKIYGQATTYAIEGDIKGAYNNVEHDILLNILHKRIKDKKFLKVMSDLLKSGIMEKNKRIHSIKGTPQGGIISPLLFNIYMHELDKFIYQDIILPLEKGNENKTRKRNPNYTKIGYKIKQLKSDSSEPHTKEIKSLIRNRNRIPSYSIESLPKKAIFSRYADDWVLLFTGSKKDALIYKDTIKDYINHQLKMELDENKTLITKITSGISFLGFKIQMYDFKQNKITHTLIKKENRKSRILRRTTSRKITINPDKERLLRNLLINKFCNNEYFPIGKRSWSVYDPYEIVLKYRQIMVGIVNYYNKCDNPYILNRISYILQYSCAKTIACRQKVTMSQIFSKYGTNLSIKKEFYKGTEVFIKNINFTTFTELKKSPTFGKQLNSKPQEVDPFHIREFWRTKIKIYESCCICGNPDDVAMHHINSLRKIKQNKRDKFEYIRSCIKRIQIPVCRNCHNDLTHGRYDRNRPIEFYNEYIAKL